MLPDILKQGEEYRLDGMDCQESFEGFSIFRRSAGLRQRRCGGVFGGKSDVISESHSP